MENVLAVTMISFAKHARLMEIAILVSPNGTFHRTMAHVKGASGFAGRAPIAPTIVTHASMDIN
jgi:hypothetical protein